MPDTLKIVFVPWGANDFGDDIWLVENALIFCLQSVIDILPPVGSAKHADLYTQLGGDKVRVSPVAAYTEQQIRQLAAKAPADTDAIVDGQLVITRDPDTNSLQSVQIAPRIFEIKTAQFHTPDSIIFDGFAIHHHSRDLAKVTDPLELFTHVAALADAILEPLGVELPSYIDGERLLITESWEAFGLFIKAKRLARSVEEKRGYYKQALRADSEFYWALFNEGQILKGQRDFMTARKYFMDSVKAAHGDPALLGETYFEIGLCSVSLGDPKTARNFWDQALIYAPNNPTLLVNIAGTYEQENLIEKALELHQKAVEIDPTYHKAIVSLGRLEAILGNLDQAIRHYEHALELQPNDALRHAILGGCYLANDQHDLARQQLEMASELDPPRPKLGVVTGSDSPDDLPVPGEYARQELAKLDEFERVKTKKKGWW